MWLTGLASSLVQTMLITWIPPMGERSSYHNFCEALALLWMACMDVTFNRMELHMVNVILLLLPLALILVSYSCIAWALWTLRSSAGQCKALGTHSVHLAVVSLFCSSAVAVYLQPTSATTWDHDKFLALLYGNKT